MLDQEALTYHSRGRHGKLEVVASKPCLTQRDLSLAYTPGVAVPCRRIHENPEDAYAYTGKGNLVAVVSNGTAVLGLGDIGPLAGKPVMEGKGVLFKRFADIDVFDIELDTKDADEIIRTVEILAPTFGGVNLEDIRAPECFVVEETLRERLDIPVFHDDQHGTAIISGAALLNALEIVDKDISQVRIVFNGAGAAGLACAHFYLRLGVARENLILCDSAGVVHTGRDRGMNPWKAALAADTPARSLADAMRGADVFVGLSIADSVTPEMVRSMADRPIVFAMANPDPEITWERAREARPDVLMATGRSDYPNQVNNVLGFPFIFRGALDVRASAIDEGMKTAAAHALADLARQDVPDSVMKAYGLTRLGFGPDYLIPKPFDHRVLLWEATAVARAAMESGLARRPLDLDEYRESLERRLGKAREVMRVVINRAKRAPKKVVFPEGGNEKILRACQIVLDEGFATPILLGARKAIERRIADLDLHLDLDRLTTIDPATSPLRETVAEELWKSRRRKGMTRGEASLAVVDPTVWAALMVRRGDADALVAGIAQHYPETLRPALQIIGTAPGVSRAAGAFLLVLSDRVLYVSDPTVNIDPTAEELADIALLSAREAARFHLEPRVAMISFSNFGSVRHERADKVRRATEILRRRAPDLPVDGEMQVRTALDEELLAEVFPWNGLGGEANVLVFPDIQSANAAYQMADRLAHAEVVGPILMGMDRPVHLLQYGCDVKDVVHMTAIAAVGAEEAREKIAARHPEPVLV